MEGALIVPRITTRGYYDRRTAERLKQREYGVYPVNLLGDLVKLDEFVVVVHGMRNDSRGAASKVLIVADTLENLNYAGKVIGFSYDSDVIGGHQRSNLGALQVAREIAIMNGLHLARFVQDINMANPNTRIRIMGHSLGSEVVVHAIRHLSRFKNRNSVEAVYLFAASIGREYLNQSQVLESLQYTIRTTLTNYYFTNDEELQIGHSNGHNPYPAGLYGIGCKHDVIRDVRVHPLNHRFSSYAAVMPSFP
ncbi:MAG: alpha/beta hydrolase [Cenarchaeum sp. SB0672_bin_9]|nr:alpha/beta hydrolase [Cenarchaeum sp. SB0672_bin_9]